MKAADIKPDEGRRHHRPEYAAPAVKLDHRTARERGQDRRDREDQHEQRHQPCRLDAGMHVTHHGARNDHAGSASYALQEAEGDQRFDIGCERAADGGESEDTDADIERDLAAPHVRQRAIDELGQRKGNEEGEQAELRHTGGGTQVPANFRQGGQIHIDGEGADGR
jgi:hypothetical protein